MATPIDPRPQPRNPLHGQTLEAIVGELVAHYGWDGLGARIPLRCFTHDPSIASSLKLLRRTPWARQKVEGLYLFMLRERRRITTQRRLTTREWYGLISRFKLDAIELALKY